MALVIFNPNLRIFREISFAIDTKKGDRVKADLLFFQATEMFPIRKDAIFYQIKEIKHERGGVVLYAAQANAQIDAELVKKGAFPTETICCPELQPSPVPNHSYGQPSAHSYHQCGPSCLEPCGRFP